MNLERIGISKTLNLLIHEFGIMFPII
jgi:hypothetical protein